MNTIEEWTVVISARHPHKDMVLNLNSDFETCSEMVTVLSQAILKNTKTAVPVVFTDRYKIQH